MADARDLKSRDLISRAGSSPASRTTEKAFTQGPFFFSRGWLSCAFHAEPPGCGMSLPRLNVARNTRTHTFTRSRDYLRRERVLSFFSSIVHKCQSLLMAAKPGN